MTKGLFDVTNYARHYHCEQVVKDAIHDIEMLKIVGGFYNDSELEELRLEAEYALKCLYGRLNSIVDVEGEFITKEYRKRKTLF